MRPSGCSNLMWEPVWPACVNPARWKALTTCRVRTTGSFGIWSFPSFVSRPDPIAGARYVSIVTQPKSRVQPAPIPTASSSDSRFQSPPNPSVGCILKGVNYDGPFSPIDDRMLGCLVKRNCPSIRVDRKRPCIQQGSSPKAAPTAFLEVADWL